MLAQLSLLAFLRSIGAHAFASKAGAMVMETIFDSRGVPGERWVYLPDLTAAQRWAC